MQQPKLDISEIGDGISESDNSSIDARISDPNAF